MFTQCLSLYTLICYIKRCVFIEKKIRKSEKCCNFLRNFRILFIHKIPHRVCFLSQNLFCEMQQKMFAKFCIFSLETLTHGLAMFKQCNCKIFNQKADLLMLATLQNKFLFNKKNFRFPFKAVS